MKLFAMTVFLLTSLAVVPAHARQGSPSSALREVHGTVVDKDEKFIVAAVVYLQNVRTLTVKTYISDDSGQYHFSGLDPNVDYELHAEHNAETSSNHTISSFDNRKAMVVTLKVDKEKKKSDK
jgi:hypothetical protein